MMLATTPREALAEQLLEKIETRTAEVGVIGLGYVGLPLALLFCAQKFSVTGFDIDEKKIQILNADGSYICRIPPTEIQSARNSGFAATSDYQRIAQMDVLIICVPTPLNQYHEPDLSYITRTAESVSPHLHPGLLVILESTYRCVNIALVNELKPLCLRMGLDIWEVIRAAATKPFGFQPFYPGPGLGGHCIPVDPFYLSWKAKQYDFHTRFIALAGEINMNMPYHVVACVAAALNEQKKTLNGASVLILGVAYKKDIDDLRESPSLTIIELLQKQGAQVSYNDPYFPFVSKGRKYDLQMKNAPLENLGQYDCVVIVTDHSDYDYKLITEQAQLVVDTRNATHGINSKKIVHC